MDETNEGKAKQRRRSRAEIAAVQLRPEPAADSSGIKIRWPEGMEVELPRSLGEATLRRCLREVLQSRSR
jgi:hypothetical protein